MRRVSPRRARRMMEQLGMKVEEVPDAQQVIIKTPSREIVIDEPEVTLTQMHGQRIYQVVGGKVSERQVGGREVTILEEDVQLVAQQAKVSLEAARKALEQTEGDLAQAILLLSQSGV